MREILNEELKNPKIFNEYKIKWDEAKKFYWKHHTTKNIYLNYLLLKSKNSIFKSFWLIPFKEFATYDQDKEKKIQIDLFIEH